MATIKFSWHQLETKRSNKKCKNILITISDNFHTKCYSHLFARFPPPVIRLASLDFRLWRYGSLRSISAFGDTARFARFPPSAIRLAIARFPPSAIRPVLIVVPGVLDGRRKKKLLRDFCWRFLLILDATITLYGQKTLTAVRQAFDDCPTRT